MKNIAILIGNSEYDNLEGLPCCKKDVSLMKQMLELSEKFEIKIFENYRSEKIKEELANFIRENQNKEIGDLLFYYTGHGVFDKQFFYLPTNFDDKKLQTTSLSNDELDDMIRSLNAGLVIKFIDACYSGQQYIKDKDINVVKNYFEKYDFNKCYFFFSSLSSQQSYGNKNGSNFTLAIIKSIISHTEDSIRYRDIQSYIADSFKNDKQTPLFVQQADATEVFLPKLSMIKKELKLSKESIEIANKEQKNGNNTKILENLSKDYITQDEARSIIVDIFKEESIKKYITTEIYDLNIKLYNDYRGIENIDKLYNEIEKNREVFFINIRYRYEKYKTIEMVPKCKKGSSLFGNTLTDILLPYHRNQEYEEKEVEKIRKVVDNFSVKDGIVPVGISVAFIPKKNLNILNKYIVTIITLHNDIDIVLYSNLTKYNRDSWNSWGNAKIKDWIKNVCIFKDKDKICGLIVDILQKYYQEIQVDIDKIIVNSYSSVQQGRVVDNKKQNIERKNA